MRKWVLIALGGCAALPAFARNDVAVSIGVNEPGVYGRVDIGNYGPPPVVYSQPVVIAPGPYAVQRQPIYMYVPAQQQHHWRRYCAQYGACGQPVYFVQERWVRDRWEREHHRHRHDERHDRDWHDRR
jgi:hypothetical protein